MIGEIQVTAAIDPEGAGPRLFFQRVPEGTAAMNRLHLDVRAVHINSTRSPIGARPR